jgi:hypothetical protein
MAGWSSSLLNCSPPLAAAAGLIATGPFNLGSPDDFRVPDGALHRGRPTGAFLPTAALVVEILSPYDETWEKFGFYAAQGVDEILVVSASDRSLWWWVLDDAQYVAADRSSLLGPASATWRVASTGRQDTPVGAASRGGGLPVLQSRPSDTSCRGSTTQRL